MNQLRDQRFYLVSGRRILKPRGASGLLLQVRLNGAARAQAQRVPSCVVQERCGFRDRKIRPDRKLRHSLRLPHKPKLQGRACRSTGSCPGQPAAPIHRHTNLPITFPRGSIRSYATLSSGPFTHRRLAPRCCHAGMESSRPSTAGFGSSLSSLLCRRFAVAAWRSPTARYRHPRRCRRPLDRIISIHEPARQEHRVIEGAIRWPIAPTGCRRCANAVRMCAAPFCQPIIRQCCRSLSTRAVLRGALGEPRP